MNLQIFTKLFYYELRRILLHKFYLGIFLVCMVYHYLILRTETILGVSHTAPFSGWSFGIYLGHSVPLLLFIIYFFFYQIYYGADKNVWVLTSAAPISPSYYWMIRCIAIFAAVLLLIAAIITEGILFLYSLFPNALSVKELLLPAVSLYLPMLSLCFGFALFTIRIHLVLFLGSAVLLLLLEPITGFLLQNPSSVFTEALSLSMSSYFIRYPLTLADADMPFFLIKNIMIIRSFSFFVGCGCLFWGIRKKERKITES